MKIKDLFEEEKNLIGLSINGAKVEPEAQRTKWGASFNCNMKGLTSLEGAPLEVGQDFTCNYNQLTSLKHAPKHVGWKFECIHDNLLTSLKDVHKHIKSTSLLSARNNPIKSHVLGVLLIKDCVSFSIDNKEVQNIILKYLPNIRGHKAVAECQDELIEADLDEYAQL